jgi:hypothetical protein
MLGRRRRRDSAPLLDPHRCYPGLPAHLREIHVLIEVRDELSCEATPPFVGTWMEQPPQWLEVFATTVVASERSSGSGLR